MKPYEFGKLAALREFGLEKTAVSASWITNKMAPMTSHVRDLARGMGGMETRPLLERLSKAAPRAQGLRNAFTSRADAMIPPNLAARPTSPLFAKADAGARAMRGQGLAYRDARNNLVNAAANNNTKFMEQLVPSPYLK